MNEIKFTPGTVYDVAHLRPFDLAVALKGHPLATDDGYSVRLFRMHSESGYIWDWWHPRFKKWQHLSDSENCLADWLRLAPLGIKDGRGLHVDDEIEMVFNGFRSRHYVNLYFALNVLPKVSEWRWPEGEK